MIEVEHPAEALASLDLTVRVRRARCALEPRVLEPLFAAMAGQMGSRSLASLKFYVENGTPYAGKARDLLPIPVAC